MLFGAFTELDYVSHGTAVFLLTTDINNVNVTHGDGALLILAWFRKSGSR